MEGILCQKEVFLTMNRKKPIILCSSGNGEQRNGASSIARKMSSLRSFLDYYYKKELLTKNVAMQMDMPKLHEKAIVRLEPDEVAIITLFLGTGIRVSECVGLDLNDVNFRENSIRIIRKGGNESILYFGAEVENALLDYIEGPRVTAAVQAAPGEENALFFFLQKKRISVHAVQNLVEKYAKEFVPQKKITPHKLRSTFDTNLY